MLDLLTVGGLYTSVVVVILCSWVWCGFIAWAGFRSARADAGNALFWMYFALNNIFWGGVLMYTQIS